MRCLFALVMLLVSLPAFAQQPAAPAVDVKIPGGVLTVLEALNVGAALRQLGDYPEVGPDGAPTGKKVSVPFKFDGSTYMIMAVDIDLAEQVQKYYKDQYAKVREKYQARTDLSADKRQVELNAEVDRIMSLPANVTMMRFKEEDLCMNFPAKPPCMTTNTIPPLLLGALIKIIDRR